VNFFRSEEHVKAWHRRHPDVGGAATSVAEAFKLGARLFGGLLAEPR
jgi:hypothetical protein